MRSLEKSEDKNYNIPYTLTFLALVEGYILLTSWKDLHLTGEIFVFILLHIITESIYIPNKFNTRISPSGILETVAILSFTPLEAAMIIWIAAAISHFIHRVIYWQRIIFNAMQLSLSVYLAGQFYQYSKTIDILSLPIINELLRGTATALLTITFNLSFITLFVWESQKVPFFRALTHILEHAWLFVFIFFFLGIPLAIIYKITPSIFFHSCSWDNSYTQV